MPEATVVGGFGTGLSQPPCLGFAWAGVHKRALGYCAGYCGTGTPNIHPSCSAAQAGTCHATSSLLGDPPHSCGGNQSIPLIVRRCRRWIC